VLCEVIDQCSSILYRAILHPRQGLSLCGSKLRPANVVVCAVGVCQNSGAIYQLAEKNIEPILDRLMTPIR
jgi:hypothetical protein